jgi:ribosomal protein S18 acetylase RimI-like enzyme
MAVVVRRLEPAEWRLLRAVRLRALADAPYAFGSTFAEEAERDDEWWAASATRLAWFVAVPVAASRVAAEPVGLVAGLPSPDGAARGLISMWVDSTHRGGRAALRLLDAVERWARSEGAPAIVLSVSDRNERARRFYARQGYVPTGRAEPLHSDPTAAALELRRELPPARLRFAPTSSGHLHAGHVRNAVLTWVLARQLHGEYFVRLEDTDRAKVSAAGRRAVLDDLRWLGLLGARGPRVQEELTEAHRSALGSLYGTYDDEGAVRFRLPTDGAEEWDDLVLGRVAVRNDELTDPVLVRSSGTPTFALASTVDDASDGVTHVVRVRAMLRVTAVQRHLWRALGATPPGTAHTPVLTGPDRAPLRVGTTTATVDALREQGIRPSALLLYLAMPQTASWPRPPADLGDIVDQVDVRTMPRRSYVFDAAALERLNRRLQRLYPGLHPGLG